MRRRRRENRPRPSSSSSSSKALLFPKFVSYPYLSIVARQQKSSPPFEDEDGYENV